MNNMSLARSMSTVLSLAFCFFTCISCEPESSTIPVERVTVTPTSLSLTEGETSQLKATVFPQDADNKSISWTSSNKDVASVSGGTVTAVSAGSATITVTTEDGKKTATCSVTVQAKYYQVTEIKLDKEKLTLQVGGSEQLTATISPANATDKTVVWSISDTSIATVSEDGLVEGVKPGTATITAKAGEKSATCAVTVVATPVTSVTLDKTTASLKVGETVTLTATVKPDDATDKTVTWSTSDSGVATISNGVVTAVKVGTATITAQAGDKSATCSITVVETPVTSVTLDKTSASLKAGETVTLTATVKPDNATNKTVTWSTSNSGVATVSNGMVTAVKVGTATITAKAGDKSATCSITVVETPVTSVTLNKTSASLKAGETVTLTATVKPDNATDKTVTWSTSDSGVATVSNGVVTAVKVGTATITAKAGEKTATCSITVVETPVTSVTLDITSASLKAGETVTLIATVKPDNATDKTVTWSTSNSGVATVSNGVVTAKAMGNATITAKAGDKTATCEITVTETPVTNVSLNITSAELMVNETLSLSATISPGNATYQTVTWSTSDNSVAIVAEGLVTAKALGTAVITAAAGGRTATCSITVIPTPVTSVSLNKSSISLLVGEQEQLSAIVAPNEATDKTVIWSSLDDKVACVDNTGKVIAIGKGETIVIAQSSSGGAKAECKVSVTDVQSGGIEDTTDEEINL